MRGNNHNLVCSDSVRERGCLLRPSSAHAKKQSAIVSSAVAVSLIRERCSPKDAGVSVVTVQNAPQAVAV